MNNNIYKDYICSFCNDFFNSPRECPNCHQNFCKLCIEKIKLIDCNCPNCRKSIKHSIKNIKILMNILKHLIIIILNVNFAFLILMMKNIL